MYDVTFISDIKQDGIRKASFQTCAEVCSEQIDIETEGDIIRRVKYTKGFKAAVKHNLIISLGL
jgi:hypothetical protein